MASLEPGLKACSVKAHCPYHAQKISESDKVWNKLGTRELGSILGGGTVNHGLRFAYHCGK